MKEEPQREARFLWLQTTPSFKRNELFCSCLQLWVCPDQEQQGLATTRPLINRAAVPNVKHNLLTAGGCNLCPRAGPLCGSLLPPRRTLAIICICLVLSCSLPLVISCGDPGTLPNGIQFGTDFTFNKTVSYQCNPGYLMEPPISPTILCTKDGTWNQSRPVCKGVCHRLPGIVGLEVRTGQCCIHSVLRKQSQQPGVPGIPNLLSLCKYLLPLFS